MKKSFAPIAGKNPKILILRTLPGKESLRLQQYYGHPRNVFWKILFSLFHEESESDYIKRTQLLKRNKSAQLYNKYINKFTDINYYTLLPTSPENASYTFPEKLVSWKTSLTQ